MILEISNPDLVLFPKNLSVGTEAHNAPMSEEILGRDVVKTDQGFWLQLFCSLGKRKLKKPFPFTFTASVI